MTDYNSEPILKDKNDQEAQNIRSWYLDPKEAFPRRPNTSIEPLICGAEAFGALEQAILRAEKSICIITWGFDPSLRLSGSRMRIDKTLASKSNIGGAQQGCLPFRNGIPDSNTRPRIGDLLLYKASMGVQVRILVWNDILARLARVDENLPESGPEGKGPGNFLHRSLWRAKLYRATPDKHEPKRNDANWALENALGIPQITNWQGRDFSEEDVSRLLTVYTDKKLKNYCGMLARFREDYEYPFKRLNSARASASKKPDLLLNPIEHANSGFEDSALHTLKEVHKLFLGKYWRGYPCTLAGLGYVDSPSTQLDDHYYNTEWFLMVKARVEQAPTWIDNIKIEYRGQERAVDGGASPAFKRVNQVAARLEKLIPKIQKNRYFLAANEYVQDFLIWWDESDLTRAGEDAYFSGLRNLYGEIENFLKTNDVTNLYGLQDRISEMVDSVIKVPLDKLAVMVKSSVELEQMIKAIHVLAENGVRTLAATYHQKTVVIDYDTESSAVGFVMGHNLLKNYLDDHQHLMFDSPVRYPEFGPWQDISCRVRGSCLEDLVKNFHESWADAPGGPLNPGNKINPETGELIKGMGQVVRTALNPGGVPPDEGFPSMEVIYDWTAGQLEVVCNLIEEALGEDLTRFDATVAYYESGISALKERLNEKLGEQERMAAEAQLRLLEARQKALGLSGKAKDLYASSKQVVHDAGSAISEGMSQAIEKGREVARKAEDLYQAEESATYRNAAKAALNPVGKTINLGLEQAGAKARELGRQGEEFYNHGLERAANALDEASAKAREYGRVARDPKVALAMLDGALGMDPNVKPAVRGPDRMSIYKTYLAAINECSNFIYTENQYFRHESIAEAVKKRAREHTQGTNGTPPGKPIYWFVVTNHPVSAGEAPNTHKMLGILNQQERLGQITRDYAKADYYRYQELVDKLNKLRKLEQMEADGDFGKFVDNFNPLGTNDEIRQERIDELACLRAKRSEMEAEVGELEKKHYSIKSYGNSAKGPFDVMEPSDAFKIGELEGLNVLVATLGASDKRDAETPALYTNIYVHSKLLVVDDAFMSLGSANINRRSMHVDAELNINTDSNGTAMNLRKKLFEMHTRQEDADDIKKTFRHWKGLMDDNWRSTHRGENIQGFLLHFCDPDTPAAVPTD